MKGNNMVNKFYENVLDSKEKVAICKEKLEAEEKRLKNLVAEYRLASVKRVLEHIRSEYNNGRLCNLDTLLCHCENKLNGNIDGVELDLKEGNPMESSLETGIVATGLIRRLDDLGRIVIPKEIRRKILNASGEGTPFELYVKGDEIILRRYKEDKN